MRGSLWGSPFQGELTPDSSRQGGEGSAQLRAGHPHPRPRHWRRGSLKEGRWSRAGRSNLTRASASFTFNPISLSKSLPLVVSRTETWISPTNQESLNPFCSSRTLHTLQTCGVLQESNNGLLQRNSQFRISVFKY
jgi:hypothetical protein